MPYIQHAPTMEYTTYRITTYQCLAFPISCFLELLLVVTHGSLPAGRYQADAAASNVQGNPSQNTEHNAKLLQAFTLYYSLEQICLSLMFERIVTPRLASHSRGRTHAPAQSGTKRLHAGNTAHQELQKFPNLRTSHTATTATHSLDCA